MIAARCLLYIVGVGYYFCQLRRHKRTADKQIGRQIEQRFTIREKRQKNKKIFRFLYV